MSDQKEMSMSKHTPAPWLNIIAGDYQEILIDVGDDPSTWNKRKYVPASIEDLTAMAAAPDLLEALKGIKAEFERLKEAVMENDELSFVAKVRDATYLDGVLAVITTKSDAAIAKAEGKTDAMIKARKRGV